MSETFTDQIQTDVSLKHYNTLGVDAKAAYFISIQSEAQLQALLRDREWKDMPKYVLGGGSNVLFLGDIDRLIIHVAVTGLEPVKETEESVWVRAGAGVNWHGFVMHCVERGWGGVENLSLIPGTMGAAPIQNIGAYGVELKDIFEELGAIEIETGANHIFSREECRFGYRDSIFKNELKGKYVITSVTLRLSKKPAVNTSYGSLQAWLDERGIKQPTIRDVSRAVIDIRNSKLPDPGELGNAGSFFKNPVVTDREFEELKKEFPEAPGYATETDGVKVPAGWLIERAGWKGKVVGQAGTYKQQALVIVNHGEATGRDILDLANRIRQSVIEQFGIHLVPEVNIVGNKD